MKAFGRVAVLSAAAAIGWVTAAIVHLSNVHQSSAYLYFVTSLLAFGIYSCTRGILITEFKHNARVVFLAITLGVLIKAALIAGVMLLFFPNHNYAILGVVVAQIDPLWVSAMRANTRMSDSAHAVLSAWSSFDDPITVLLTISLSASVLQAQGARSAVGDTLFGGDLRSFGVSLVWNLVFAGCTYALWKMARFSEQRFGRPVAVRGRAAMRNRQAVALLALLAVGAVAVATGLILGLALIGLFFRPAMGKAVEQMTQVALLVATCALGVVLVDGVKLWPGLVLGVAAYWAQTVVAPWLTRRHSRRDRVYLALSQQNGLTAITLALLLETDFPGAVAIVAPAILVVNLLHTACNSVWHRVEGKMSEEATWLPGRRAGFLQIRRKAAHQIGNPAVPVPLSLAPEGNLQPARRAGLALGAQQEGEDDADGQDVIPRCLAPSSVEAALEPRPGPWVEGGRVADGPAASPAEREVGAVAEELADDQVADAADEDTQPEPGHDGGAQERERRR